MYIHYTQAYFRFRALYLHPVDHTINQSRSRLYLPAVFLVCLPVSVSLHLVKVNFRYLTHSYSRFATATGTVTVYRMSRYRPLYRPAAVSVYPRCMLHPVVYAVLSCYCLSIPLYLLYLTA